MNEEYAKVLYARSVEIQPQLGLLIQDFKAMGMTAEQIAIELTFAIIHEGYRLRYMEDTIAGTKISPHERRLQTHVDDSQYKNSK